MESFFLAETLKYLYLIFDEESFLHNDLSKNSHKIVKNDLGECVIETGYSIFNTEAHPIDGAALECCQTLKSKENLFNQLDLSKLIDKYININSVRTNIDVNQEYSDLKHEFEVELEQTEVKFQKLCDKLKNTNLIISEMSFLTEMTCSTNDTFKLHVSYLNNESFFP